MIVSTGWKNLKTNSNNITLQEKKIYSVKIISMIPTVVQQQVFLRGYKRKINLATNGRRNCLFDKEEKHAFNQVVLALRKRTTIKIIAKAFGMSTRTIWKVKSNVISDNHKFFPQVNVKRIVACLSEWIRAYRLGKIKQISIYKIMREIEPD